MHYLLLAVTDRFGLRKQSDDLRQHLTAAAEWILRAQNVSGDGGVSHSYDIRRRKWASSYPETTGYIIPTLFDYAQYFGAPGYKAAARRMAEWELQVQLPQGAVRAGTMDANVIVPTVFNTGQVLFGFARAALETGDQRFRDGLKRAADWLVAVQDTDGAWRRYASPFTTTKTAMYNTRTAFGLLRAYEVLDDDRYIEAAKRNVAFAVSRATSNAWLPGNDLNDNKQEKALTHTLAYSIRGLLEVGVATQTEAYVEHALRMAQAIAASQRADGSLAGYYDCMWRPISRWSCLTGNAQMAVNWFRLSSITGSTGLRENARAANHFNMRLQDLHTRNPDIRGAIKGSHPIDGDYMRWRYPNWAAKFFMDALMLEALYPDINNVG